MTGRVHFPIHVLTQWNDVLGVVRKQCQPFVEPVREHRFVVVLRADGLGDRVNDTDPQQIGVKPLSAKGADAASQKTAAAVNEFLTKAHEVFWSVLGAMIAATIASTAVASHTGRKRAATTALAMNVLPGAVTDRTGGGATVKD